MILETKSSECLKIQQTNKIYVIFDTHNVHEIMFDAQTTKKQVKVNDECSFEFVYDNFSVFFL